MKTKKIILIIFIGISILDLTCGEKYKPYTLDIIGIDEVMAFKRTSKPIRDSISYDSLGFYLTFKTEKLFTSKTITIFNNAYADVEPPPVIKLNLDSIKIFAISHNQIFECTNQFSIAGMYDSKRPINNKTPNFFDKINLDGYFPRAFFYLNTPPLKTDFYQYNFKFFDKKGRMFEITSDSVFVTK